MTAHFEASGLTDNQLLDEAWDGFLERLSNAAQVVRDDPRADDPRLRAQGYRYVLNLANAALEQKVFSADVDFPEHGRLQDSTKRYATESPDCLFGVTSLDPAGTYRLTAGPGSAHYVGMTLYRDMDLLGLATRAATEDFGSVFRAATGSTLGALAKPGGLQVEGDGSFEVVLSATQHPGNWLELPPDVDHLITRQYFYDWDHEEPHHISIERLDPPDTGTVTTPGWVAARLDASGRHAEGLARFWALLYGVKAKVKRNVLVTEAPVQDGYAGDSGFISYGGGYLDLADDEAAIIEVTPPKCHFWNIALGDHWSQSLDYTFRQTHLNGHMAVLDPAGVFRAVVAHRDPGAANWLDTAGNRQVHVTYRWWLAAEPDVVHPQVRIVKHEDLARELHPDTPTLTAEQRADALVRRRCAVLRRYRR